MLNADIEKFVFRHRCCNTVAVHCVLLSLVIHPVLFALFPRLIRLSNY